ncbi:MAG: tol-pal system protein YbgF [candidate division KSB1 bacterium]|nr:tol-pal system protein YbgF [candidate division KSB1 bacterium]MDZ7304499.1 tol-pal system protein YbgF [candidate division KSB1 bacterium]MDZ7313879.1 tol-pal system protein YbgF [candidate division KSB1 bacterium]
MKNVFKLFLLMTLLLCGCATRKEIVNFKNDSAHIKAQVDSLRIEQRRLWSALTKLAALNEQSLESNNRLRADIKVQLDQLSEQTQLLNDRLEETSRRISNLPTKLRLAAPVSAPPSDTTTKVIAADTSYMPTNRRFEEAQRLYDSAYQDYVKGQYQLAQQGFAKYLQIFPESALADNAQYWIGECYYSQKKYSEAIQAFQTVITKYPDGEKVPAAMLKIAFAQITLGQTNSGQETLEKLIKRFPQSEEAKRARTRLQELRR